MPAEREANLDKPTSTSRLTAIQVENGMRQRITFLQEPQDSLDPKSLQVTSDSISTKELNASREDRITLSLDELPQELYRLLKASHELRIRWSSPENYETIAPLVSRISPGLHVFYTPQRSSNSSYDLPPACSKRVLTITEPCYVQHCRECSEISIVYLSK